MKQNVHPKYYSDAKVRCACGAKWITGSTKPELEVEICSSCSPFFSGKEKIMDTRGRVDKYRKRLQKSQDKTSISKKPRQKIVGKNNGSRTKSP